MPHSYISKACTYCSHVLFKLFVVFPSLLCFEAVFQMCVVVSFSPIKCAVQGASLFNSRESCSSASINTTDLEEAVIGSKKEKEERKALNDCHLYI